MLILHLTCKLIVTHVNELDECQRQPTTCKVQCRSYRVVTILAWGLTPRLAFMLRRVGFDVGLLVVHDISISHLAEDYSTRIRNKILT